MGLFSGRKKEKIDIEFVSKKHIQPVNLTKKPSETQPTEDISRHISRWLLRIPFDGGHEEHFVVIDSRPSLQTGRPQHGYEYMVRQHRWSDMYCEFNNYHGSNFGSDSDISWLSLGSGGYTHKKNLTLERLDPLGVMNERWLLHGCFPTEIRYHDGAFEDRQTMGVNFSIDNAIMIIQ